MVDIRRNADFKSQLKHQGINVADENGLAVARRQLRLTIPAMRLHGHSYVTSTGGAATLPKNGLAQCLARAFGVQVLDNWATSGGRLAYWGDTGTVVTVLRHLVPARTAAPYFPDSGILFLVFGINDARLITQGTWTSAQAKAYMKDAIRSAIVRGRLARIWEDDNAAHTYGANWSNVPDTTPPLKASGVSFRTTFNTTPGTISTAIPADYDGLGALWIGYIARATNEGCLSTVTVDGGANGSFSNDGKIDSGNYLNCVYRVGVLSAGAHTILQTISGATASKFMYFDYVAMEATPVPPVVVFNCARIPLTSDVSNAAVATINEAITEVCAEFPGEVILVDMDTALGLGAAANFAADGIHPNDRGCALVEQAAINAVCDSGIDFSRFHWPPNDITVPSVQSYTIIKSATESLTSNATPQLDDHLLAWLPIGTWEIELIGTYEAGTTGDIQMQWATTANVLKGVWRYGDTAIAGAGHASAEYAVADAAGIFTAGGIGAAVEVPFQFKGTVIITTPGFLWLKWAQAVSNGTASKVHINSRLKCTRVRVLGELGA